MTLNDDMRARAIRAALEIEADAAEIMGDNDSANRFRGLIQDFDELMQIADERIREGEMFDLIGSVYPSDGMGVPPDELGEWWYDWDKDEDDDDE